jgi:hypothetical protein
MVTRFATSPPTDNCPQPKEAQPLSQLDTDQYNILTPRLCGLMVRRWLFIGYFPILNYLQLEMPLREHLTSCRSLMTPPLFFWWTQVPDPDGHGVYYWHVSTGAVSWDRPVAAAAAVEVEVEEEQPVEEDMDATPTTSVTHSGAASVVEERSTVEERSRFAGELPGCREELAG